MLQIPPSNDSESPSALDFSNRNWFALSDILCTDLFFGLIVKIEAS